MLIGVTILGWFDNVISSQIDVTKNKGLLKHLLGWLHLGRVPLLVLLIVFLALFAISGIALQSLFGTHLPAYLGPAIASTVALAAVHYSGRLLKQAFPNVNTTAVSEDSFIGLSATIVGHAVTHTIAAEAKLTDQHGQPHYILVKAVQPQTAFKKGDVVIVCTRSGHLFYVTRP